MGSADGGSGPKLRLLGRGAECEAIDGLVQAVRTGDGRVVVLSGEPGVGKTALLEYARDQAFGCRVASVSGIQSEMELAFAGLHQLCSSMLDRLERLPEPQQDALTTACGIRAGPPPDLFLVGLGVLSLLAEVAEEQPLVCLVDDVQWLDRASSLTLAFVARRLLAERIGMVFATRDDAQAHGLAGLPELALHGLGDADALTLLRGALTGPLDPAVMDRIVADTHGNPLALLELPRAMSPPELAGGYGLPSSTSVAGRIEDGFIRRIALLPSDTRRLLLVASAEPVGDPVLVWRAAAGLGIENRAATPAIDEGLIRFGRQVVFHHPLVRSAAYRGASEADRQAAHRALAGVTDAADYPDRRSWHLAKSTAGPDEGVAAELERAATRARERGGLTAAAAFVERAATLSTDPTRRLERMVMAAEGHLQAGSLERGLGLLAAVDTQRLDPSWSGRVWLLRGLIAFVAGDGAAAVKLLVDAGQRLETFDVSMAREAYLQALSVAVYAGRFAGDVDLYEVARIARAAPPPIGPARAVDLLLDGLALLVDAGLDKAAALLRRAGNAFRRGDTPVREDLRWLRLACATASATWDHESWYALACRDIQLRRDNGALAFLPIALNNLALLVVLQGDLGGAAVLLAEAEDINEVTGSEYTLYGASLLAALRGREGDAAPLIDATVTSAAAEGRGHVVRAANWALATLYNGLGQYDRAFAAAREADAQPPDWAWDLYLHELVEAAVRAGELDIATEALDRLATTTGALGTDWPLGVEARSRALVIGSAAAEDLYREAIDRLGRTPMRVELARAHLLFGEWLRRERRRRDAREQLRTAHELFLEMDMEAFAERAARELRATGATARKRSVDTSGDLTPQEAQIAQLASEGLSNPEIGSRLFLSPRTVEYHLGKVFTKLQIRSRTELAGALSS
ncbi:MAG TPA: AAA family ATPase [Acidimicrobiales bacterium]|nr:AAA family ATPase [Acidimicrobiales bacterium]